MSYRCECGRQTNEPSGLCIICKMDGKQKREDAMTKEKCSIEGCQNSHKSKGLCNKHYLIQLKADGRIGARKGKTVRVSKAPAGHIAEHRHKKGKAAEPGIKEAVRGEVAAPKSNGKHLLGQMLYASDLFDKQISEAIDTGRIDTKVILDIRFRLGEVLRACGGLEA